LLAKSSDVPIPAELGNALIKSIPLPAISIDEGGVPKPASGSIEACVNGVCGTLLITAIEEHSAAYIVTERATSGHLQWRILPGRVTPD
jgi:hypothetical protein